MSEVSREGRKDFFFVGFEASREAGSLREIAFHAPPNLGKQPPAPAASVWWWHVLQRSKSSVFLIMYKFTLTGEELSRCIF